VYARIRVHKGDAPYRIDNYSSTALVFLQSGREDKYAPLLTSEVV